MGSLRLRLWGVIPWTTTSSCAKGQCHVLPEDWYAAGQLVYSRIPRANIDHELEDAFFLEYREFSSDCMIKIAQDKNCHPGV
ncbi:hypothetical protein LY76DRAFT_640233, partial [Colletotrichum caudatum]